MVELVAAAVLTLLLVVLVKVALFGVTVSSGVEVLAFVHSFSEILKNVFCDDDAVAVMVCVPTTVFLQYQISATNTEFDICAPVACEQVSPALEVTPVIVIGEALGRAAKPTVIKLPADTCCSVDETVARVELPVLLVEI